MEDELRKFRLYKAPSGDVVVSVIIEEESVWLTQKSMGILFDTSPQNITIHLRNIFESGELEELSTCKEILQVQREGGRQVSRKQKFYNLDAIISVGYRVNSAKATQFRIWATKTLKEYLIKGFVLDDNRRLLRLRPYFSLSPTHLSNLNYHRNDRFPQPISYLYRNKEELLIVTNESFYQ